MNHFTKQCPVKGVAFFNDKIDGEAIDSGSIFIEEELDDSKGRAKGYRTVEYKCADSQLPRALIHNTFPVLCDVTFEITMTKRGQSITVADARPVSGKPVNPAPMPKAA